MVFAIRPWLLLKTQLVFEQMQSDPWLVLETMFPFETRLLLEEIWYVFLIKFDTTWCKFFPPHLNSDSTLSCKTYHLSFAGKWQRCREYTALNLKFFTHWTRCGLKNNSSINIYNTCKKWWFFDATKTFWYVFFSIHSSNNCCSLTKCKSYVSQGSVEMLFR